MNIGWLAAGLRWARAARSPQRPCPTDAELRNLRVSMWQRRANEPTWALYYAFYRILTGRESDGLALHADAYKAASLAVEEIIPKFYVRRGLD